MKRSVYDAAKKLLNQIEAIDGKLKRLKLVLFIEHKHYRINIQGIKPRKDLTEVEEYIAGDLTLSVDNVTIVQTLIENEIKALEVERSRIQEEFDNI